MTPTLAVELLERWLDAAQFEISDYTSSTEEEYTLWRKTYSAFMRYAKDIQQHTSDPVIIAKLNVMQAVLSDKRHAAKKRAKK